MSYQSQLLSAAQAFLSQHESYSPLPVIFYLGALFIARPESKQGDRPALSDVISGAKVPFTPNALSEALKEIFFLLRSLIPSTRAVRVGQVLQYTCFYKPPR